MELQKKMAHSFMNAISERDIDEMDRTPPDFSKYESSLEDLNSLAAHFHDIGFDVSDSLLINDDKLGFYLDLDAFIVVIYHDFDEKNFEIETAIGEDEDMTGDDVEVVSRSEVFAEEMDDYSVLEITDCIMSLIQDTIILKFLEGGS